jgi:hypothetical protein
VLGDLAVPDGDNVGGTRFGITVGLQAGDGLGVSSAGSARSDFAPYNQQEKGHFLPPDGVRSWGRTAGTWRLTGRWCVKGS